MSIKLSDSIRVGQQKPLEDKYFNELVPYTSTTQVNTLLPKAVRHIGLTVNINKEEYWYKDGIEDSNLVLKITNNDSYDLKNQEQDDRLENLEGENASQNDLINDLGSDLESERTRNDIQDSMLYNLEGINYVWSPTNRTLTLFDRGGTQLSQVSLVSLDNEGTDLRYNASTLSLELYNADNELLDSIPVSSFIGSVGTQLQLNSNELQLKDSQGNILSTVSFTVNNIQGLQTALGGKLDKGTYAGNASDLKSLIDTKADLVGGKVPSSQLPAYVDDVLEFANLASFPATGENGKIYIAIDTNLTYRWGGSSYVVMSSSLALGETSSTAYRGDRGKIAYDHSQTTGNPHGTTKNDIGLGNVDNTSDLNKPISTATQQALNNKLDKGTYTGTAQDLKNDIDGIQIGGRNLLIGTKDMSGNLNYGYNTTDKYLGFTIVRATNNTSYTDLFKANTVIIPTETSYVVSFYAKASANVDISCYFYSPNTTINSESSTGAKRSNPDGYSTVSINTEWKRYWVKWTQNVPTTVKNVIIGRLSTTGVTLEICGVMFNSGNKANDWTPAPEDKQDRLQDITGYIGVGKTDASATEKLDVNGNVKANGFKTPTGTANQALTANGGVFDLTTKLDKGTYTGNASDLKSLIDTKADLVGGKVPSSQLPAYVDDVLEFANLASFPATGENGKIYIAIDTNLTYRWGGSSYVVMSSSLALGETSSTAYRGDRGKIAYDHSQATDSNPHGTELEQLSDVSGTDNTIIDTDEILKKEAVGGLWRKITFANFKNWFTTELAKKINIGLDTVFNFKNISAMALSDFRNITPNIETIYFTEEQNSTGWQQVRHSPLLYTGSPALIETPIIINNETHLQLYSDSTFNLIDVENTKIIGIFENDFVIITFSSDAWSHGTATDNQWVKFILKINGVQAAVSPVFSLTGSHLTPERISHSFALNVTAEMVTHGATLHVKSSTSIAFESPSITVARVHKSTTANL